MNTLQKLQFALNAPKNLYNEFGKYKYRNCESILKELKPLLESEDAMLLLTDEIEHVGERYYVKATATLVVENGDHWRATAYARESDNRPGMDASQITGAASSYARKYALNALFLINDVADADDTPDRRMQVEKYFNEHPDHLYALLNDKASEFNTMGELAFATEEQINKIWAILKKKGYIR